MCSLICDTRENMVTRHTELNEIEWSRVQITIGDYIVVNGDKILAVIERKTLDDYGASLKDGRANNKQKMIKLREKTNCRIIYIIEGDAFPGPNDYFGNVPYYYLESSIFHLMMEYNIMTLRTKNSLHTALTLVRFVQSINTIEGGLDGEERMINPNAVLLAEAPVQPLIEIITKREEKPVGDVVRELWARFPGITVESAIEYMRHWSVQDIIRGNIDSQTIRKLRFTSGRLINKKAADSLCGFSKLVEVKLLSTVPGISTASATYVLSTMSLSRLLSYGKEMSIEIIGKNSRRIGDKLAEKIITYFTYKHTI